MGCASSSTRQSTAVSGGKYPDNTRPASNPNIELITPDPDLGWRQVPAALVASTSGGIVTGPVPLSQDRNILTDHQQQQQQQQHNHEAAADTSKNNGALYPNGWIAYFFNDRSGQFCHVSVITLAINICVRAERLAEAFGVLTERGNSSSNCVEQLPETVEGGRSRRAVYVKIGMPDFGWELIKRAESASNVSENNVLVSNSMGPPAATAKKKLDASMQSLPLQLLQSGSGKRFYADVSAVGMNIAEQLHRLERKQDDRHYLPTDSFGWNVSMTNTKDCQLAATTPTGETVWIVPEEMIMNVTQWVQQTYLTSTVF